jgi:1-acyl-sn-glycerol-3-phosphate acyltransferase
VFAQNHINLLDHCTCYTSTPHFKQGIELSSHFKVPFYGRFMKQRGTIPVHRDLPQEESLRALREGIRAEVARGHSLLVFPEGTRTLTGRVGPFRGGVLRIAHELELPIVPVAVTGMFEVLRKGEPYIRPGRTVTVYIEKPIETKGVPQSEVPALIEQVRSVIAARVNAFYGDSGHEALSPPNSDLSQPTRSS